MPIREIGMRDAMRVSGYTRNYIQLLIFSDKIRARKIIIDKAPGVALLIDLESLKEYLETQGREANVHLIES